MSNAASNDLRKKYEIAFANIRGILDIFPEDKWLKPHGDEYYIPCRIAYHLAVFINGIIGGGFKDPDFAAKLPYGNWLEATSETLPDKKTFIAYFDDSVKIATEALAAITDDSLLIPFEPDNVRFGATPVGMHLQFMRELSDHTGELNKMLIENGLDDVWLAR